MTLRELANSTMIIGSVEIRAICNERRTIECLYLQYVKDLSIEDIKKYENCNVARVFSETFEKIYPNSRKTSSCIVIEVTADKEDA